MVYGFRIMVYDAGGGFILSKEACNRKQQIRIDAEHYEAIAPKTATVTAPVTWMLRGESLTSRRTMPGRLWN